MSFTFNLYKEYQLVKWHNYYIYFVPANEPLLNIDMLTKLGNVPCYRIYSHGHFSYYIYNEMKWNTPQILIPVNNSRCSSEHLEHVTFLFGTCSDHYLQCKSASLTHSLLLSQVQHYSVAKSQAQPLFDKIGGRLWLDLIQKLDPT